MRKAKTLDLPVIEKWVYAYFYDGEIPGTCEEAESGYLLGASTTKVRLAVTPLEGNSNLLHFQILGVRQGIPTYCRLKDETGTTIAQVTEIEVFRIEPGILKPYEINFRVE